MTSALARVLNTLTRHLSVQGSATSYEALSFYKNNFDIRRGVLPRVLSLDQVRGVAKHSPVELEVFAFGSLCIMAEGRCYLSSYLTDESPNTRGALFPGQVCALAGDASRAGVAPERCAD